MKGFWHIIERYLGIYRWHPTIALRYLPMIWKIQRAQPGLFDVLEVGSGGLGIAPYLKRSVVGVDLVFPPPVHPQLVPVKASAARLPFADNSFAVVVSSDMLEHLSKSDRVAAISEMM